MAILRWFVRWRGTWRGVPPARRAELKDYQEQVHRMRIQYQQTLSDLPSSAEVATRERQERVAHRETLWREYLARLQSRLDQRQKARAVPTDSSSERRHMEEQRSAARAHWAHQLGRHQIARRKYLAQLVAQVERPEGLITRETLEARIEQALAHPINYASMSPAQLVREHQSLKESRQSISMRMDPNLVICQPPPTGRTQ